jgi:hypothetical protein
MSRKGTSDPGGNCTKGQAQVNLETKMNFSGTLTFGKAGKLIVANSDGPTSRHALKAIFAMETTCGEAALERSGRMQKRTRVWGRIMRRLKEPP